MTSTQYKYLREWFLQRPKTLKTLKIASKLLTMMFYAAYGLLLIAACFLWREKLLRLILVPMFTYLSGSLIRKKINAPRPYEVFGEAAIVKKDTAGKSFPSRHSFCAAVIAMAFMFISPAAGVIGLVLAALMAFTRVLTGVHWPKDVISGWLYGALIGYLGFFMI